LIPMLTVSGSIYIKYRIGSVYTLKFTTLD
jgi:hypothetical protein